MARIKQPQLPAGALNDFFAALHDLHLKAGYPSTREIQRDIGRGVVSHTTIHKAFAGPRLPGWEIIELLVEALADRSRRDREEVIGYFRPLWEAAAKELWDSPAVDADRVRLATQAVRETIQHQSARPFADLMRGTLDGIEAAGRRSASRELIPSGFADMDTLTGGLWPGHLAVIASRPSIGKSMVLITMCAQSAVRHGLATAIFSNEMTERDIQTRILSAEARVPHHLIRSGQMSDDDWTRLARQMSSIIDAPLWISYSPCLNISGLENGAKALASDGQLRLLAIDNIDALMTATNEPEQVLYRLKQLAVELDVPILVTAQMRRPPNAAPHVRPEIGQLWHAELIEAVADVLVLLNRPDADELESPRAGEIDFVFAKNRHGATATTTLAFQSHYCRVVDLFIPDERHRESWYMPGERTGSEQSEDGAAD